MAQSLEQQPADVDPDAGQPTNEAGENSEAQARAVELEHRMEQPLDAQTLEAVVNYIGATYVDTKQPDTRLGKLLQTEQSQIELAEVAQSLNGKPGEEPMTLEAVIGGLQDVKDDQTREAKLSALRALSIGWQEYIREQNKDKVQPLTDADDRNNIAFAQLFKVEVAVAQAINMLNRGRLNVQAEQELLRVQPYFVKYASRADFPQESRTRFQEIAAAIKHALPEAPPSEKSAMEDTVIGKAEGNTVIEKKPSTTPSSLEGRLTPEDSAAIRSQAQELIRQANQNGDWLPVAQFLAHARNAGMPFKQDEGWQQLRDQLEPYQGRLKEDPQKLLRLSVYLRKLGIQQEVPADAAMIMSQYFEEQKRNAQADSDDVRQTAVFLKYVGISPNLDDDGSFQIFAKDDDTSNDLAKTVKQYAQLKYLDQPLNTAAIANASVRIKELESQPIQYVRTAALLKHYGDVKIIIPKSMHSRLFGHYQQLRREAGKKNDYQTLISFTAAQRAFEQKNLKTADILPLLNDPIQPPPRPPYIPGGKLQRPVVIGPGPQLPRKPGWWQFWRRS